MSSDYGWIYTDSGKEMRVLGYAINAFKENDGRLFGVEQNSFTKEIESKILRDENNFTVFSHFIDSNGDEVKADPPDFCFNSSKIALELFYASDITLDNGYNIEAKSFKDRMDKLAKAYGLGVTGCKVENKGYENFVNLSRYRENLMETIKNHFIYKKVLNARLEHWNNGKDLEFSYKGFLIVDLGHLYIDSNILLDCKDKRVPHMGEKINHLRRISSYQSIYMPWRDTNIMEYFYKYACDFVIWWQPRRYNEIMFDRPEIGEIAVIDTRDKSKLDSSLEYKEFIRSCGYYDYSLIEYEYDNMVVICDRGVFDNKDSKVGKLNDCDYLDTSWF